MVVTVLSFSKQVHINFYFGQPEEPPVARSQIWWAGWRPERPRGDDDFPLGVSYMWDSVTTVSNPVSGVVAANQNLWSSKFAVGILKIWKRCVYSSRYRHFSRPIRVIDWEKFLVLWSLVFSTQLNFRILKVKWITSSDDDVNYKCTFKGYPVCLRISVNCGVPHGLLFDEGIVRAFSDPVPNGNGLSRKC